MGIEASSTRLGGIPQPRQDALTRLRFALAERAERPERLERPERQERPERLERPERQERPERLERATRRDEGEDRPIRRAAIGDRLEPGRGARLRLDLYA